MCQGLHNILYILSYLAASSHIQLHYCQSDHGIKLLTELVTSILCSNIAWLIHVKLKEVFAYNMKTNIPHLKSPHQPCGTPHNICGIPHQLCGIPQKHAEYQHFLCGIPHEHAELRRGFTICGISSASLIGNFSAPAAEKLDLILF